MQNHQHDEIGGKAGILLILAIQNLAELRIRVSTKQQHSVSHNKLKTSEVYPI